MVFKCWPKCCQWNYNTSIIVIVVYPNNFLFVHGALDFICKCIINVRCSEQCVVTQNRFDKLHIKVSYIMMLSCFIWKMKFKRHYSSINFDNMIEIIKTSLLFMENENFNHNPMNLTLKTLTLTSKHKALPQNPKIKLEKLNPHY